MVTPARTILLLALDPTPANRNKIARYLRELARPDLSIIICKQILEDMRLNYYSLTVLCGAYCDLGFFDQAIEVAQKALKFSPMDEFSYPLNALTRAHTLKFKSNGDISEIEAAINFGHQSIAHKLDMYSANAFISAAVASGNQTEIDFAKDALSKAEPQLDDVDLVALIQAYKAAQALAPTAVIVEVVEEFSSEDRDSFDSLYELVLRDEGFKPTVLDLRNMDVKFKSSGWFLQGLSDFPCNECQKVSLHSYRKHFRMYGKEMHYWCLVCAECKTATDSVDYPRKDFILISSNLEEKFPSVALCSECG